MIIWRNYSDIIIINIITLGIALLTYFGSGQNVELLGAILAIGISLSLGLRNSQIENDRVFQNLFTEFNNRYDMRFNDLLNQLKENNRAELSLEEQMLIIDYLNLCAEEYLWYRKKRIPSIVWHSWRAGILQNLQIPQVIIIYDKNTSTDFEKGSLYGLYEELEKYLV